MKKYACPCCDCLTLEECPPGTYEVCPVCGWEDDKQQFLDDTLCGGANAVCLRNARENYVQCGMADPNSRTEVRPPLADELPAPTEVPGFYDDPAVEEDDADDFALDEELPFTDDEI